MTPPSDPKKVAIILAIVAVYIFFRFWRLGDTCLWFDEMFSVQAATLGWGAMLRFLSLDLVHPPLFYVLLKVWILIGGEAVFWVRTLPVLFACLAIVPFLLVCRELKLSSPASALALLLFAANGSLIKYAQEARMYTMMQCLSLCSIWLFLRFVYRDKSILPLAAVNLIAVYTHYFAWTFIGCELLLLLIFYRQKLGKFVLMLVGIVAAFLPWAINVVITARSGDLGENIDWIQRPGIGVLFDFVFDLVEPFYYQQSSDEPASLYRISVPLFLIAFFALIAYAATRLKAAEERKASGLLFLFSAPTLLVVFVASWLLPYSVWGTRHLTVVFVPISMFVAYAVTKLPIDRLKTAAITGVLVLTAYAAYASISRPAPQYVWCGWEPLIADVQKADAPIELYASENLAGYHSFFANRWNEKFRVNLVKAPPGEFIDKEYFPPRGFDGVNWARVDEIDAPHILLIYRVEPPLLTDWLKRQLLARGYSECHSKTVVFGRSTLVRVELTKEPGVCRYGT